MSDFEVTGRCLCASVIYKVSAPAKSLEHCHCSQCRRAHGALSVPGAVVDSTAFEVVAGRACLKSHTSSPGNHRWFCANCGCHIFMTVDHIPHEIYYWPASLDYGMQPGHPAGRECHIFVNSKAHWDRFDEVLTQFPDAAEGDIGIGNQ